MLSQSLLVSFLLGKLELHNISLIPGDFLLITNVNCFSALRDQSHIVRNHNHPTFELVDTACKCINGFHIQRVCGYARLRSQQKKRNHLRTEGGHGYTTSCKQENNSRSSSIKRCGFSWAIMAKTILAFWPADN